MKKILIRAACVVALSSSSALARTTADKDGFQAAAVYEANVDVTEQASVNVRLDSAVAALAPGLAGPGLLRVNAAPRAGAATALLPEDLRQYVTDTQTVNGSVYVTLTYPAGQDAAIKARLKGGLAGSGAPFWPGSAAGPAAGLFAFGFLPAMPVLSRFRHPDGSVRPYPPGADVETNFCRDKQPQSAPVSRPAHSAVPGQTITLDEIAQ